MSVPRRLRFGEVAETYDRHRPAYPAALIDDLLAAAPLADGRRALEVGAGTGKATVMVARRGTAVLAIEPSAAMAAVARRNCATYPGVQVAESDFEHAELGRERFGLVYAAQAWHWIDPELRYARARGALVTGGLLAAFWNRPAWGESELRDALRAVYERLEPEMPTDGPMHPANRDPDGDWDWSTEIAAADGFADPRQRTYEWAAEYGAQEYTGLLSTLSEFRMLEPEPRRRLLDAVGATIEAHGGRLAMPMFTLLNLARAV